MAEHVKQRAAVVREYGPFASDVTVHGVTYDGTNVWAALGDRLQSFEPASGRVGRALAVHADAGSAFDGHHLFQLSRGQIQKIDPQSGAVLSSIPSPAGAGSAGLTWAEGTLWVTHYRERTIHQVDPKTGHVLATIPSARFVTGVTFVDGELWHGTWENDASDLRHVDRETGEVRTILEMPEGVHVSGLEADGGDLFYCGGATAGTVRAVRRPKRR